LTAVQARVMAIDGLPTVQKLLEKIAAEAAATE
jgi:hypothetical protein